MGRNAVGPGVGENGAKPPPETAMTMNILKAVVARLQKDILRPQTKICIKRKRRMARKID